MCRLFGLTAGNARVKAAFWLLEAPDSLRAQSHRNADGAGLGFFGPAGEPVLDKQPEPAFSGREFIREARQAESPVFVAHVRWATAGGRTVQNTQPFAMNGRLMAHNGSFGELAQLEKELGSYARLVLGETDSERYFALITKETDAHGGDAGAGITAAASWIAARLPVSALNTIVAAPGELWALRYPGQHALCTSLSVRQARVQEHRGCMSAARRHRCTYPSWKPWPRSSSPPSSSTERAAGACSLPANSCTSGPISASTRRSRSRSRRRTWSRFRPAARTSIPDHKANIIASWTKRPPGRASDSKRARS
ncbi:MAG: class II glutamine amidotransferase [Rhodomicrobium sp.]